MALSTASNKANPSNFQLVFPILPAEVALAPSRDLTLNVFGTIVPSLNLEDLEIGWQGGKIHVQSGKLTFDPLSVSFMVDSELRNWSTLVRWIYYINNNMDKFAEVPKEYVIDASLKITDNFNQEIVRIIFRNVWVQQVGELTFSMREGENTLESSATFLYDRYEIG